MNPSSVRHPWYALWLAASYIALSLAWRCLRAKRLGRKWRYRVLRCLTQRMFALEDWLLPRAFR